MAEKKYVYAFKDAHGLGKEFHKVLPLQLKLVLFITIATKKSLISSLNKSKVLLKILKKLPERISVAIITHF